MKIIGSSVCHRSFMQVIRLKDSAFQNGADRLFRIQLILRDLWSGRDFGMCCRTLGKPYQNLFLSAQTYSLAF